MVASVPGDNHRRPPMEGNVGHESRETILLLVRSYGTSGGRYRGDHIGQNDIIAKIFLTHCRPCAGRRFFSTEQGRIGIGPRQLASGDKIYVLLQARPLFISCSCKAGDQKHGLSTKNALRGHAYVHGLVHGETFDLTDRGPDELINIC